MRTLVPFVLLISGCEREPVHSGIDAAADGHSTTDGRSSTDAKTDAAIDGTATTIRRAFVTVGRWNAALGGLMGADAKCQVEASAAALTGTYLAWLGDNASSPATRFTRVGGPFVRTDGVVIANSWSDLVDATLAAPLNVNADGTPGISVYRTWTNVNVDGTTDFAIYECTGWTSSDSVKMGAFGDPDRADARWTRAGANGSVTSCFFEHRLYCFEQ